MAELHFVSLQCFIEEVKPNATRQSKAMISPHGLRGLNCFHLMFAAEGAAFAVT